MEVEAELAARFGADNGQLFARGSTALYALFAALADEMGPGEVVIPSICCETVPLAAIYAGLTPVFCDVQPLDGCMTAETIAPLISDATRAVVVVHIFGSAVDLRAVRQMAEGSHYVLIEDVAQAVGGCDADGIPLGTSLDYTLLSFADDKILPGRGGALLTHSRAPSLTIDQRALPAAPSDAELQLLAASLRNLVHGCADLARATPNANVSAAFQAMIPYYRKAIVRRTPADVGPLPGTLNAIGEIRDARFRHYAAYRTGIKTARVVRYPVGTMVWRCSVIAADREHAVRITSDLRNHDLHASNHYFPLDQLFGSTPCPEARDFASRIVNLWVDPSTADSAVERTIEVINKCAKG